MGQQRIVKVMGVGVTAPNGTAEGDNGNGRECYLMGQHRMLK